MKNIIFLIILSQILLYSQTENQARRTQLIILSELLTSIHTSIQYEIEDGISLVNIYIKEKNKAKGNSLNNYIKIVNVLQGDYNLTVSLKLQTYCLGEKDNDHSKYKTAMEGIGLEYPTKRQIVEMIDILLPRYTNTIIYGKEEMNEDLLKIISLLEKMKHYLEETKIELSLNDE
jgi:hypothetical protein